jgi:hypothetical protein
MKKLTAIILICMLIVVGCGDSDSTGNKVLDGELELESNQSLVIAQVIEIYGNEITLALAKKVNVSTTRENIKQTGEVTSQNNEDAPMGGNRLSDGKVRSNRGGIGWRMPSKEEMPANSKIGSSSTDSSSTESFDKAQSQMQATRYTLTGEEISAIIPVGTPVTTLLGTVTTFSRIAVENTLQIVTEKNSEGEDIIVAIYIVG